MAYATQTDIERAAGGNARLKELADWDNDGAIDAAAIEQCQKAADGYINSFAAVKYAVPVQSPSDTLVQFAAQECVYQLKLNRGALTEKDEDERKVRLDWLKMLSKGQVRPSDPAPPKSDAVRSETVDIRTSWRDELEGYR